MHHCSAPEILISFVFQYSMCYIHCIRNHVYHEAYFPQYQYYIIYISISCLLSHSNYHTLIFHFIFIAVDYYVLSVQIYQYYCFDSFINQTAIVTVLLFRCLYLHTTVTYCTIQHMSSLPAYDCISYGAADELMCLKIKPALNKK